MSTDDHLFQFQYCHLHITQVGIEELWSNSCKFPVQGQTNTPSIILITLFYYYYFFTFFHRAIYPLNYQEDLLK